MRTTFNIIVVLTLTLAVGACTGDTSAERKAAGGSGPNAKASVGGGTVEAEVKYHGEPLIETIQITKDAERCGKEKEIDKIAVGANKGLRDAVVSVAQWKGKTLTGARERPVLDQKNCEFRPRVLAMMAGEVDVLNSDGVLHNIHTSSTANEPINKAQPKFKQVMTVTFDKPETIRVRCDVHSSMEGWIVVVPHPYFGVTGRNGETKIENVPPGNHTIEVWHPVLGSQKKEVEVKTGQTTKVTFQLKS